MNWTAEQLQIIEARGCDLLVSAAAGSGKTAVLVERIIRMITDPDEPIPVDRLVIMTFTRAAAEEMRERITAALRERIARDPDNRYLQLQKAMLPRARITTIDSICQNLIKQNYALLELDPGFRVPDEGEVKMLAGDAMDQVLEQHYEASEPDFCRFAEVYSGRSDEKLRSLIEMLYRFIQAAPWPLSYLAEQRAEAKAEQAGSLSGLKWMQYLFHDVHGRAQEYAEMLETAKRLCEGPGGPLPYLAGVEERLAAAQKLTEFDEYASFYNYVSGLVFSNLKAVRGQSYDLELKEQVKVVCDHFRDYIKNLKTGYAALPPEVLRTAVQGTAPYVQMLLQLTEEYLQRFEALRREKNVVDFTDMEHLALSLLYTEEEGKPVPSEFADMLSQNFAEILVDEYQDSNSLQEALVRALSAERFGRPDVFMVGDVKQSIYRFRLARPEIFMEKYGSYLPLSGEGRQVLQERILPESVLQENAAQERTSEYGTENEAAEVTETGAGKQALRHRKIELNRNFRSRGEVLRSINCLFDRLMQAHVGGVEYTEETALHQGASFLEPEEPQDYRTELLLLDLSEEGKKEGRENGMEPAAEGGNPEKNDGSEEGGGAADKTELEARMIAERILDLLRPTAGKKPFLVMDRETGGFRPASFRDIVILLRAPGSTAEKLVDTLALYGIPAYTENASGYFSAVEVETMLAYLSIVDNPHQDIPLAAVLRSPAGGFTDEELALLRAAFDREREKRKENAGAETEETVETGCTDLYAALCAAAEQQKPEGQLDTAEQSVFISSELAEKAAHFLAGLKRLREHADFMPVHRVLAEIYRETGYYAYASAMPMGRQRRKNLDMLLQRAQSYSETSYSGIFNFVRYIEQIKKYDMDYGEASAVSEQDDLVRITSIHKSKGLEYPIVILAGLHRQFNRQDLREALLIDADLGIGGDYVDLETRIRYPGLKKEVLKQKMLTESDGEELRVLYVAMTRAKEKLIMTAAVNDAEQKLSKWRGLSSLLTGDGKLPKGVLLSAGSLLDFVLLGMPELHPDIVLKVCRSAELGTAEQEREAAGAEKAAQLLSLSPTDTIDPFLAAELADNLEAVYPNPEDTRLSPKKTVSEVREELLASKRADVEAACEGKAGAEEAGTEKAGANKAGAKGTGAKKSTAARATGALDFDDLSGEETAFSEACGDGEYTASVSDRYEKLRKQEEEKGGAKRGNAYHRVLQLIDLDLARERGAKEAVAVLRRRGLISEEERMLVQTEAIERFVQSDLSARMAKAQKAGRLFREQRFMIGLPARILSPGTNSDTLQLLQGIIDAYFENEDGSITLIDYKTDHLPGLSREEAEAELRERYQVQLALYRRALEQLLEKEVAEAYIYSTYLGGCVEMSEAGAEE